MFTRNLIEEIKQKLLLEGIKDSLLPIANTIDGNEMLPILLKGSNKRVFLQTFMNKMAQWTIQDIINISKNNEVYSLQEAVKSVGSINHKIGQMITFIERESNEWRMYQFHGQSTNDWYNLEYWKNQEETISDLQDQLSKVITWNEETDEKVAENANKIEALNTLIGDNKNTIDNYTINGYKVSSNPKLTKVDVGLSNVDNTADKDKPISTATSTALAKKADLSSGKLVGTQVPVDEEDVTVTDGKIKLKDRGITNGMGYKVLRRPSNGILTQDMINQSNTIYEIRYNFDLNGTIINIPENCILKFEGGSLNNGSALFNGYCKIEGYGWKLNLPNGDFNVEGLIAYVDPESTLDNSDGSKNKPYRLINEALQYAVDIRIKANSSINTLEEIKYLMNKDYYKNNNSKCLIPIKHTAKLSKYGFGNNPVISLLIYINNANWTIYNENNLILYIDLKNSNLSINGKKVILEEVPSIFYNIGSIDDGTHTQKLCHKSNLSYLKNTWDFYNTADKESNTAILYVVTGNPGVITYLTAGLECINCEKNKVIIKDLEISNNGRMGICGIGSNSEICNCIIHDIGGSVLSVANDGKFTLYGNGIESYGNYTNILIHDNVIYNIYDSAITLLGTGVSQKIKVYNNKISSSYCGYESWGNTDLKANIFSNVFINIGNNEIILGRSTNSVEGTLGDTSFGGAISLYNQNSAYSTRINSNIFVNCDSLYFNIRNLIISSNNIFYTFLNNRIIKYNDALYKIIDSPSKYLIRRSIKTALQNIRGVNNKIYFNNIDLTQEGTSSQRPVLTSNDSYAEFYDTTLNKQLIWNGTEWVDPAAEAVSWKIIR